MSPKQFEKLDELLKSWLEEAKEANDWCVKNNARCGHSNTPDALGDEGWRKLNYLDGKSDGMILCASQLMVLLVESRGEK